MPCECTEQGYCKVLGRKLDQHSWNRCHRDEVFNLFIRRLANAGPGKAGREPAQRRRRRVGRSIIHRRQKPKFPIKWEHIPETFHKHRCAMLDTDPIGRANCPKGGLIYRYRCDVFGVCTTRANIDSLISCTRCPLHNASFDFLEWETQAEKVIQPDHWKVGVTSAPGRDCLGDTIEQLQAAGFADITVFAEPGVEQIDGVHWHQNRHKLGAWGNRFNGLCHMTFSDPTAGVLMVEDDIRIKAEAKSLLEGLEWSTEMGVASLYKPGGSNVEKYRTEPRDGWLRVQGFVWGSLAVAWSPYLLTKFIGDATVHEKDKKTPNYSDTRIYYWCARNQRDISIASPSMVDHRSELPSTIHRNSHSSPNARAHDFQQYDVALITPTRNRHETFKLCEHWISRQDFTGSIQWIVADDSDDPVICTMGQQHIRRARREGDPRHSLALNLRAALPHIKSDKVLVIEDDDYYAPDYVGTMVAALDSHELVGFRNTNYLHLDSGRIRPIRRTGHAPLSSTGFRMGALGHLKESLMSSHPSVDMRAWESFTGDKHLIDGDSKVLSVKSYYRKRRPVSHPDVPVEYQQIPTFPAVIYTANFGDYDRLSDPPTNVNVPTLCFADSSFGRWEQRRMAIMDGSPRTTSRYVKMLPHRILPEHEWSVYMDGNIRLKRPFDVLMRHLDPAYDLHLFVFSEDIVREANRIIRKRKVIDDADVTSQLQRYHEAGMPNRFGVFGGGFLVRRDTPEVREFNELWWSEYQASETDRDQLCLPYAIWRSGIRACNLGRRSRIIHIGRHRRGWSKPEKP